ncbi:MAG: photosystem II complex extrinsic protein PsbU [Microcoleaceae cyanobacterium]
MKTLGRILATVALLISSWGLLPQQFAQSANFSFVSSVNSILAVEDTRINRADDKLGQMGLKIDLNHSSVRSFSEYRGMYPNLAALIVRNAPFENVNEVLDIPGLNDKQKDFLKEHLDSFTVTPVETSLNEGDNRFNDGIYD